MSKITIIEGNSNDKDNMRAFMVKGEPGDSPTASVSKEGDTATITITDYNGTTTASVTDGADGLSPTASVSKVGKVTTLTVTDGSGTTTSTINDGEDGATYEVPTGSIVGFDGVTVPGGYEEVDNFNILTLSMSGSNTLGNGSFYEQAGVVHINGNCAFGSSTSTSNWNDIGTIPEGYRPSSEQWFPVNCLAVSGSSISGIYPAVLRITTAGLITMLCKNAVASCQFNAEWKI